MRRQMKVYFKIMVFLNVVSCSLLIVTNVSEEPAASIFRVEEKAGRERDIET
jgi:hypothetical protein